jgi:hypothetical protein
LARLQKKRARADADKRLRRRDILRAAAQAFAEAPLSSLTMTPMATPSAAVARVLALPELAPMRVDFAAELQLATTRLLRGWREPRAR